MLEELQRLQAHVRVLKTRLAEFESENQTLSDAQLTSNQQHQAQIEQKNDIINSKEEEIKSLTDQLGSSQTQLKQLNEISYHTDHFRS